MANRLNGITHIETADDIEAFLRGLTLFGTGGGGLPRRGREFLTGLRNDGFDITWTADEELSGDQMTACVFGMGSIAPHKQMPAGRRGKGRVRRCT